MTAPVSVADRILDCFPGGTYALTALLRLLDIVESDEVPTAAVECREQPRLLVNPGFVAQHAETPEKLLMLVMHELHHVLLGHTTLFPTITPVQNFVFDAVINGIICRMFPEERYTSILTGFYDAGKFPECLLRPPPGWPVPARRPVPAQRPAPTAALVAPASVPVAPASALALWKALYSDGGATYKEVFDILPKHLGDSAVAGIPLLGGHDPAGATGGGLEHRSPLLFDVVRGIVERWPQPPDPIRGRSLADILSSSTIRRVRTPSARAILRGLIRKVAASGAHGRSRIARLDPVATQLPIPAFARRTAVLRALGHEPLLHPGIVPVRRIVPAGERVHVYLDVSGSMEEVKGALYGSVLDCRQEVHPVIHLFSTKVADISLAELRRGVCRSTGGTDIACVAEHMARCRIGRALIVTDGWVGVPAGSHRDTLARARLAVAWLGDSVNTTDLAAVANHTAHLPTGGTQ